MNQHRHRPAGIRADAPVRAAVPIRLDALTNPYGPSPLVGDAVLALDGAPDRGAALPERLRRRVAEMAGVPVEWVMLGNGADELLANFALATRDAGAMILFPPAETPEIAPARRFGFEAIALRRAAGFAPELDLEMAAELPPGAVALVGSPSDPTGAMLSVQDAVRLARACSLVIVDERHGGYGPRSLASLAREFDNVVVIQSFELWAGLDAYPVAWAITPPKLRQLLVPDLRPLAVGSAAAGLATLDDLRAIQATTRAVRQERSRLYRMLRKLNLTQPLPSWANFLLVKATRSDARQIADGLAARSILVHQPQAEGLHNYLRVSAGLPRQTDALRDALIEVALEI
ncbi:MAG: aminotransferase class I/II-fold pyridoxal phosphate-dependent enzyme [Thermomicrobiales bacterium]|nr:aminotransferase class I/II-fold pyridoxal phosphate-dependent enzyme [Thermomicrobiales bacterium]